MNDILVVKVGGSLFDMPDLATRLRHFLQTNPACQTILFPGGGASANAVRAFDRTHHIGEEAAHWLAVHALSLNARFLGHLLRMPVLGALPRPTDQPRRFILDPLPFFQADERDDGRFPHLWQVTSDSLTMRVGIAAGASDVILLKSRSWLGGDDWQRAAQDGIVDRFFPEALRRATHLSVRIINLRDEAVSRRGAS